MNKKTKIILIVGILGAVMVAGYYFLFSQEDKSGNTVADNTFGWKFPVVEFPITGPNDIAYSDIRDPGGIPEGLPVRLKIPVIGVDTTIEDALITPDGRMDVPQGSTNVAWFALGPNPGDTGSAVIGGHFGIRNGVKFVFYDLDKLVVGDKIYIEDDEGNTLAFQVRRIQLFDRNADATTVFTSDDGIAHLNLITCEGIWNRVNDAYPSRRVVFTDAIPSEGPITVPSLPLTAIPPTPSPAPTTVPTPTPTSPTPTPTPTPTSPTPILTPTLTETITTPQILIPSAKNLYATPINALVTSLLLLAILFMIFKIVKR